MVKADGLIQQIRRKGFLARLYQLTRGATGIRIKAGDVGYQLGMPMEATLYTVAELHDAGLIHQFGELDLPHGPEVHLTAFGAIEAREAAEWAEPASTEALTY